MKLLDLRKEIKITFSEHQIDKEDADFIIAEVLGVKRTELVLIDEIDENKVLEIKQKANLRISNIPVEKIFNKAYFYGLEFEVDDNVLSPRPESELLVEQALKIIKQNQFKTVLDMCTGSGCLAIAVKKNSPVEMTAVDVSSKALQIAKTNAKNNNVEIKFIKSNMFDKVEDKFDVIISNPPYIDTDEVKTLQTEVVEHDPLIALDGGAMGLKFYNIIHENLRKHLNDGGYVILEIGEDQKDLIMALFNDVTFVECVQDYAGLDRIMIFKK